MNLVRLGHYFAPTSAEGEELAGSCRTALVVDVGENSFGETVNIVVWSHVGEPDKHLRVQVAEPSVEVASFHLSGDCPWSR